MNSRKQEVATLEPAHSVRKYAYIDASRGYAVLLVITCHVGTSFAQIPYPVRKLADVGWHGVQLFFLVSCVTLLMSWRSDERKGIASPISFWLRRFFRIAPMYYLAGGFYFFAEPPAAGFSWIQLITSFSFVNAWSPFWTPTVPHRWMVVPGGWSIGVEFTFYFLFPIMVFAVRSLRSAAIFFGLSLALACVLNSGVLHSLETTYGEPATFNFLYFWFPNQLPIFALGTVLFFLIDGMKDGKWHQMVASVIRWRYAIIAANISIFVVFAEKPQLLAPRFSLSPFWPIPFMLFAALIFSVVVLVLSQERKNIFINGPICALGEVSFSAYILHFFVIHELIGLFPQLFDLAAAGYRAIGVSSALWFATVPITFALSWLTFRLVEKPMIGAGRAVLEKLNSRHELKPRLS